jgi:hypothetical protein
VSDHRSPPPAAAPCLDRPRPSSQKGGTLIAENVADLGTHRRLICDPDGYRPSECQNCYHPVLHMHERRYRLLLGDPEVTRVDIAIYRCANCDGVWRILPRFVARHLWRSWRVVEAATSEAGTPPSQPKVPERTLLRWHERLRSKASLLVQLLATSGNPCLEAVVHALGIDAVRGALVASYTASFSLRPGAQLASLSALIHRLGPGIRLM